MIFSGIFSNAPLNVLGMKNIEIARCSFRNTTFAIDYVHSCTFSSSLFDSLHQFHVNLEASAGPSVNVFDCIFRETSVLLTGDGSSVSLIG